MQATLCTDHCLIPAESPNRPSTTSIPSNSFTHRHKQSSHNLLSPEKEWKIIVLPHKYEKYQTMPPRKRPKLSSRAPSSTPQVETAKQPTPVNSTTESAQRSDTEYDLVNDPWTDEQETALLKSIVRWKPVGIHASSYLFAGFC